MLELSSTQIFWTWIFFGFIMFILLVVMAFCLTEFALALNYIKAKKRERKHPEKDLKQIDELEGYPMVTIQLPIFNEIYVAERVIRSAANINYPKDRLQIQILDDSTDETAVLSRSVGERIERNRTRYRLNTQDRSQRLQGRSTSGCYAGLQRGVCRHF